MSYNGYISGAKEHLTWFDLIHLTCIIPSADIMLPLFWLLADEETFSSRTFSVCTVQKLLIKAYLLRHNSFPGVNCCGWAIEKWSLCGGQCPERLSVRPMPGSSTAHGSVPLLVSFLLAAWQLALLKIDCCRPFHGLHVLLSQSRICHEWRKQNETLYDWDLTHMCHTSAIRTHKQMYCMQMCSVLTYISFNNTLCVWLLLRCVVKL